MDTLTTTIRREPLDAIISRTKRIEYRELKPYWTKRLARVSLPFALRLINGMRARAPEATLLISKVKVDRRNRRYELHIGRILVVKHLRRTQRRSRR